MLSVGDSETLSEHTLSDRFKGLACRAVHFWRLLLLGGDIETNPGPMTKAQEEKLDMVFTTMQRLEASNVKLLESVNKVLCSHIELKNDLESLTKRVDEIEGKFESFSAQRALSSPDASLTKMQNQIKDLESKCASGASTHHSSSNQRDIALMQDKIDDLENRSRRSNLLFYGIQDTGESEGWETSEQIVKKFCEDQLGVTAASIARAHRLGRFSNERTRPIIVKFFNEKEIDTILSNGHKLKDTEFGISRDYSEAVREKRRKLWQFSKTIKKEKDRVNLVFNKLKINKDVYIWDTEVNCAKLVSPVVSAT